MHWEKEERELAKLRELEPKSEVKSQHEMFERLGFHRLAAWADERCYSTCGYCNRKATTKRLVVSPETLHRYYENMCGRRSCQKKLEAWQGAARARRARAQSDWEHEHGGAPPLDFSEGIPVQYPSLSRATLRAFLDSDLEAATVRGAGQRTVSALNGSIRSLGFANEVYAEIRSGEAVLRRVGKKERDAESRQEAQ
jgi:hypothetical protein